MLRSGYFTQKRYRYNLVHSFHFSLANQRNDVAATCIARQLNALAGRVILTTESLISKLVVWVSRPVSLF